MEEIRVAVLDAFLSLPHGGLEIDKDQSHGGTVIYSRVGARVDPRLVLYGPVESGSRKR